MCSLTESNEWKQLSADYSEAGSVINIKKLFAEDPQRFNRFR